MESAVRIGIEYWPVATRLGAHLARSVKQITRWPYQEPDVDYGVEQAARFCAALPYIGVRSVLLTSPQMGGRPAWRELS